jgi:hypothetical protein
MSKIFEKMVLKQMLGFIDDADLLGPHMPGFRKGHSTTTAFLVSGMFASINEKRRGISSGFCRLF